MKIDQMLHKLFGTTPGKGVQPKEAIAYSVAGFGQNFICTIIGSYLTIFLTDALLFGADGVMIGTISGSMAVAWLMLGCRIFDALNDPIMGSIVDRTRTKWGKCRPYLKWMAFPIAFMTIACFLPVFDAKSKTPLSSFPLFTFFGALFIPLRMSPIGLSTCMTNDTVVRGNILTVARLACTLGAGIVTVFVPIITNGITSKYKYASGDIALTNQGQGHRRRSRGSGKRHFP